MPNAWTRPSRTPARHPGGLEGQHRNRRHADNCRVDRTGGIRTDQGRLPGAQAARCGGGHHRQGEPLRVRPWLGNGVISGRADTQPVRPQPGSRRFERGTAVAVTANFAAAGLGTDTCGSIRLPAAHNDLYGLRPTSGLSSRAGVIPFSTTMDAVGPMARSVVDLAIMLDATVGRDPADPIDGAGRDVLPERRRSRWPFGPTHRPGHVQWRRRSGEAHGLSDRRADGGRGRGRRGNAPERRGHRSPLRRVARCTR